MGDVNILSIVIATLMPMILGMIYYSKPLFGKTWMASIGMTEEKQKEANMPVVMGVSIVMAFLMAMFLLSFCNGPGQEGEFDTFKHGAFHGGLAAFFLAIPVLVSNGLFEQRPWKSLLINGLYWFITLMLMGGVLDVMNHFPNVVE